MKKNSASCILKLIVWDRLATGMLYIILSLVLLHFLDRDLGGLVKGMLAGLNLDVDLPYIHQILTYISGIDHKIFILISFGLFLYGSLFLIQAYGLYKKKRWAEYLTIIAVGIFIPFEMLEVFREPSIFLFAILLINSAIVLFLIQHKELFPKRQKNPVGQRESTVNPK